MWERVLLDWGAGVLFSLFAPLNLFAYHSLQGVDNCTVRTLFNGAGVHPLYLPLKPRKIIHIVFSEKYEK
jgi:hypothetical protein